MSNLYEQLKKYRDTDYYPFHMPGHKRNMRAFGEDFSMEPLAEAAGIDITEIDGFDNLHEADGIIKEAQQDAAALYGAEETFFLVGGSTCGILSAISASTGKGDRILVARNSHKSVYHAAYLKELSITWLYPCIMADCGAAGGISPDQVEQALQGNPSLPEKEITAVVITSPTYEGAVYDIAGIADIVHKYGKLLIVDEAHGAHFGLHPALPENAVRQGADIVIHSLHKSLPALTQTALLHVTGERVDREALKRYLRIFQTSSPSYVLMASIDFCINGLRRSGKKSFDRMLACRERFLEHMAGCTHLKIINTPLTPDYCIKTMEPGKLVIAVADGSMSGQQLYDVLRVRYHLQMEMAAERYVIAILTIADTNEGMERLAHALIEIDKALPYIEGNKAGWADEAETRFRQPTARMTIAQAYFAPYGWKPLKECRGETAAEFINLYPPGIPLVVPGEKLSEEILEQIERYIAMKLPVQGIKNNKIKIIISEGDCT